MLSFTIEGKLAYVTFLSRFNVVFGNTLVLMFSFMIHGKLVCIRFPSWCNVVFGNACAFVIRKANMC